MALPFKTRHTCTSFSVLSRIHQSNKRSHHILAHFRQRIDRIQKKTAEFEAADNGSNAYYKNDTGA